MSKEIPAFQGFRLPTTTQVPDEVFDILMPHLSGAELKVLLYICRRTFGFRKVSDDISLSQICRGITTRDGRVLDSGTGLHQSTVITALKGLLEKNVIVSARNASLERGDEPTTYALNFQSFQPPVPDFPGRGSRIFREARPGKSGTQQTVLQQTEEQQTDPTYLRKGLSNGEIREYPEDRQRILEYLEDIARELGDISPLKSSVTRAVNLYQGAGLTLDEFTQKLLQARAITKEQSAQIKGDGRNKKRMAYFFGCLENILGSRERGDAEQLSLDGGGSEGTDTSGHKGA